mgnify:FL=1
MRGVFYPEIELLSNYFTKDLSECITYKKWCLVISAQRLMALFVTFYYYHVCFTILMV